VYQHLNELASPIKSLTIGPHTSELLVDQDVIRAIKDGMLSGNDQVIIFINFKNFFLITKTIDSLGKTRGREVTNLSSERKDMDERAAVANLDVRYRTHAFAGYRKGFAPF